MTEPDYKDFLLARRKLIAKKFIPILIAYRIKI